MGKALLQLVFPIRKPVLDLNLRLGIEVDMSSDLQPSLLPCFALHSHFVVVRASKQVPSSTSESPTHPILGNAISRVAPTDYNNPQ